MVTDSPLWYGLGVSVRGPSHDRAGLPNQDAIAWFPNYPKPATGAPLILAVSDGHGSAKSFRSQIGAQSAVETAIRVLHELFITAQLDDVTLSAIYDTARTRLPQRIVKEWTDAVTEHWHAHAIDDDPGWQRLMQQERSAQQLLQATPTIAYGATLLAVLVTDLFVLYLQLGDGDILCVNAAGQTFRPIADDPRLIANETTSLCTRNAWQEIQVRLVPFSDPIEQIPTLILVSSDGYSNSYPSEAEFSKIGGDYLDLIRRDGFEQIAERLPQFLAETTEGGSGDDITLGLIRRLETGDRDTMIQQQTTQGSRIVELEKKIDQLGMRYKSLSKQLRLLRSLSAVASAIALLLIPITAVLWFNLSQAAAALDVHARTIETQKTTIADLQQKFKELSATAPDSSAPTPAIEKSTRLKQGHSSQESGVVKQGPGQ